MGDAGAKTDSNKPAESKEQPIVVARTAAGLTHFNTISTSLFSSTPITSVKVLRVTFKTAHAPMKDNTKDWSNTGTPYPKTHWEFGKPAVPFSHSKNLIGDENAKVEVVFEVNPAHASPPLFDKPKITGSGAGFQVKDHARLSGGNDRSTLEGRVSMLSLPHAIAKITGDIEWKVTKPSFDAGASWGHTVFITFDEPIDAGGRETGITYKRMEKAVELVDSIGSNDTFTIVEKLMNMIPGYELSRNPAVPAQYKHPTYFNDIGGAWWLADYMPYKAECQAIVRFVRAVLLMVGCPGDFEPVVIYADVDDGSAKEGSLTKDRGLASETKTVKGETWFPVLTGMSVTVGSTYTREVLGPNNYEACLKVTLGSFGNTKTKYYGGGAGKYRTPDEVLKDCFRTLCWVTEESTTGLFRVREIVKVW